MTSRRRNRPTGAPTESPQPRPAGSLAIGLPPGQCVDIIQQLHRLMTGAFTGTSVLLEPQDGRDDTGRAAPGDVVGSEVIVRTSDPLEATSRLLAAGAHSVTAVAGCTGGSEVAVGVRSEDRTTQGLAEVVTAALSVCARLEPQDLSDARKREQTLRRAFAVAPRPRPDGTSSRCGREELFLGRLRRWSTDRGEAVAVRGEGSTLTYTELDEQSARLAGELERRGVGPGSRVMVLAARCPALVTSFVAALRLGASVSLIDPRNPAHWLVECERALRPALVLGLADDPGRVGLGAPVMGRAAIEEAVRTGEPARAAAGGLVDVLGPDDEAIVTFTSGSTGKPKAVAGRYGSLTHFYDWMDRRFGPLRDASFAMCSSLGHDPLQRDIMTPLFLGGSCVIPPDEVIARPSLLGDWLVDRRIAAVCLNPVLVPFLVDGERTFDDLRLYVSVGAPLPRDHAVTLRRMCPSAHVVNLYGSTESQRAVAFYEVPTDLAEAQLLPDVLPLGRGMVDVDIAVVSPSSQEPCLPYEVGEVALTSDYLSLGYLVEQELVRTAFREVEVAGRLTSSYLTGDLGFSTPDLGVVGRGRVDEQVKIAGHRVEPAAIDAVCRQHPAVTDAATVTATSAGATVLATFVVLGDPTEGLRPEELRSFLADRLPSASVPTVVSDVPTLPLTVNSKVDRVLLQERARALLEDTARPAELVASILQRHTGGVPPARGVALRDLGIDSLRFEVLLVELARHFPVERTLGLRHSMTLDELDAQLSQESPTSPGQPVEVTYGVRRPIPVDEVGPPSSRAGRPRSIDAVSTTAITVDGVTLDHLCSNDYLGLGGLYGARDSVEEFFASGLPLHSHGSMTVNADLRYHRELADGLRELHQTEEVVLYSSAFLANVSALGALAGRGDEIFLDESAHRSMVEGALLSGARLHVFDHNDVGHLESLIESTGRGRRRRLVATEGLFSVEGDVPDLEAIATVSERHGCVVLVDEACSVGQIGRSGRGIGEHHEAGAGCIQVRTGTLAKSLGAAGGYVTGLNDLVSELRGSGGAAFSTGLPPISAFVAARAVRGLLTDQVGRVAQLRDRARAWRELLVAEGLGTGSAQASIVPVAVPGPAEVERALTALIAEGAFAVPIRPPWSAMTALRTAVTADHDPQRLPALAAALARSVAASTGPRGDAP